MRIELLNHIRCPLCKTPLELTIFEINEEDLPEDFPKDKKDKLIEIHGSYDELIKNGKSLGLSEATIKDINIKYGLLFCNSCKRWYPIGNYIPTVPELYYPDNLRNKSKELKFIKQWKDRFPEDVLTQGLPWNISDVIVQSKEKVNK